MRSREDLVAKHEEDLARLAKEIAEREEALKAREIELARLLEEARSNHEESQSKTIAMTTREVSLAEHEAEVAAQGERLKSLAARMKAREEALANRETEIEAKAAKTAKLEETFKTREDQLKAREAAVAQRETGVANREAQINTRSSELIQKSNELTTRKAEIAALASSAGQIPNIQPAKGPSSAPKAQIPSMDAPVVRAARPSSAPNVLQKGPVIPPDSIFPAPSSHSGVGNVGELLAAVSDFSNTGELLSGSGEFHDEPSIVELELRDDETREFMNSPATSAFRPNSDPNALGANPSEISVLMADQLMLRNSSKGSSLPNDEDYLFQQIQQSSSASMARIKAASS